MRTRTRYLPLVEAAPGMMLGAAVQVAHHGRMSLSLPEGHTLTEDNLHQLTAHRAEYIFVSEPDPRSDEQVATDAAMAARRLLEIFSGADLSDPTLAALFDQVLGYRSA